MELEKKRVLVVEDFELSKELMEIMLAKIGCITIIAENGTKALEKFSTEPLDLIFMDIRLPDISGMEVTRRIRRMEKKGQHIPIIAATANVLDCDRQNCIAAGMDDYLDKPIRFASISEILKKYLP